MIPVKQLMEKMACDPAWERILDSSMAYDFNTFCRLALDLETALATLGAERDGLLEQAKRTLHAIGGTETGKQSLSVAEAHAKILLAERDGLRETVGKLPERLRAHLDEYLPKCNGPGFLNRGMERACIRTFIAGWEAAAKAAPDSE